MMLARFNSAQANDIGSRLSPLSYLARHLEFSLTVDHAGACTAGS